MKKLTYIFTFAILTLFLASNFAAAQKNPKDEWLRMQSESGEFSIEFPAEYDFYGDNAGFDVADRSASYRLSEMRVVNAYRDKTLLSFEIYKTDSPKNIADLFAEREEKNGKKSEVKIGDAKFKQIIFKNDNYYAVRRFYWSKDFLYILSAASRDGETAALKRFLDSLNLQTSKMQIEPAQIIDSSVKTVSLANLKLSNLEVEINPKPMPKPVDQAIIATKPETDENALPLVIFVKPIPSYTESARQTSEKGIVRLRITFSENGSVKKIGFLSTLNGGLTRQAIFAATRIKFIPAEKNGEPISVTKVVEYSFSVY